jgi:hypothetical protein
MTAYSVTYDLDAGEAGRKPWAADHVPVGCGAILRLWRTGSTRTLLYVWTEVLCITVLVRCEWDPPSLGCIIQYDGIIDTG